MIIIGITGLKKSGKTTLAKFIENELLPHNVHTVGFADELKNEIACAILKPVSYIEEHKDNFRLILQGWGTDFRRLLCGENYWVERLLKRAVELKNNGCEYIIVPDVRFLNEANAIAVSNGYMIRVVRPVIATQDTHASEVEQLSIFVDYTLQNNADLAKIKQAAKEIVTKIKHGTLHTNIRHTPQQSSSSPTDKTRITGLSQSR